MQISARVQNAPGHHETFVTTNDHTRSITIPPKSSGAGSSVNGGELLFLALATCYCNDIYREAAKRNIVVHSVQVEVQGEFGAAPGSRAENVTYKAMVEAEASEQAILELMNQTDAVAEIQNTLRQVTPVTLVGATARPV